MLVPFLSLKKSNAIYESELKMAFEEFLESGHYILGNSVKTFENQFATFCESKHCIGVANGLDALILILENLGLEQGSEIIVPANTYFASILSIIKSGLVPVLVEPNIDDYLIDVSRIPDKITPKTKGILAVNLYGKMCDYEALNEICTNFNLKLIVDAAQSHGALYQNSTRCIGAIATAYSFYPTKNLGALSDAGAVITDNEELALKIQQDRNYGSKIKYQFKTLGHNSRLSELQAKFLSVKLKYFDEEINKRRQIAKVYLSKINNKKIILPPSDSILEDACHLFVIRTKNRKNLVKFLDSKQIGYDIHYPIPPHKQMALKNFNDLSLPITEEIHETILSLPLNGTLTSEEVNYIINSLNEF